MKCPYCDGAGEIKPAGVTVGALIVSARKAKGMTQANLAKCVGLSRPAIANLEVGRQNVVLATLMNIAEALGCNVKELIP